ncbi:CBBY-like protein [Linum grandiflorum]
MKIFVGDVVARKNPDPAIYTLAASTLGVDPESCVVIEDSGIGLAAAKAAGMKCIITKSGYTAEEDFLNADAVFDFIGDPPEEDFDMDFCWLGLGDIPESCVACVFTYLTPPEICNLARLNRTFCGVASSNSVWEMKLPRNYPDLLDLLPP